MFIENINRGTGLENWNVLVVMPVETIRGCKESFRIG